MSFDALPPEIIDLICSFLEQQELKALRETHSAFLVPATSCLFYEIHISPNSRSFDRALAIAADETLRHLVKSLQYHFGMLGDFYAGFESFRYEYFSIRRPGESRDPSEITAEVLWCYNCWLEELDAQRTFDLCDEEEELHRLCSRFPRLGQFTTLLDDIDDIAEPKDYIGRRTGMAPSEDEGRHRFPKLFRAVRGRPLIKIAARGISWEDLEDLVQGQEDGEPAVFQDLVLPKTLRYLELGLYNPVDGLLESDVQARCKWLGAFLCRAPDLRTLRLDFDELPYESHAEIMIPTARTIFAHHWPQLHSLKLEAIAAHEDELCNFLLAHAAKLRHLQLGDIELVKAEKQSSPPSVLRLFRRLRKGLQLRSFKITGNFTNRIDQAWYVDIGAPCNPQTLRMRIEDYVCHTMTRYPNNEIEARFSVPFDEFVENDDLTGVGPQFYSDESWVWSEELLS